MPEIVYVCKECGHIKKTIENKTEWKFKSKDCPFCDVLMEKIIISKEKEDDYPNSHLDYCNWD